jgi:parvulin-like peptidyl-prolyl isomerase
MRAINCNYKSAAMAKLHHSISVSIVLFSLIGTLGCDIFRKDYAAIVNGEKIPVQDFEDRLQVKMELMGNAADLTGQEKYRISRELLNELIDEKILLTRARALKLSVADEEFNRKLEEIKADYPEGLEKIFPKPRDFSRWKEDLKKRILLEKLVDKDVNSSVTVTDAEALAAFNANKEYRLSEERVRLSQILLPSRESAQEALNRLKSGADFASLAKEVSSGPEGSRGGDMGYFTRGVLPDNIDDTVFKLRPGQVSDIVESPYGFHIFKLEKKEKAGRAGFPAAKARVVADLKKQKEEAAYNSWLDRLRADAKIIINEEALKKP